MKLNMGIFFDQSYGVNAWHKNPISMFAYGCVHGGLVTSFNDS